MSGQSAVVYNKLLTRDCHRSDLSSRLGLTPDEGERWIVELVRDARLDAKVDLQKNIVTMNKVAPSVHQTISDRSKQLVERAQYLLPSAPAQDGQEAGGQRGDRRPRQQGQQGGPQDKQRRDHQQQQPNGAAKSRPVEA